MVTASPDSSTDMDSSPWYFSGPTSSQTLILCPRWLQWCDLGAGPGYRPGKWTPNDPTTKSPQSFVKFFSELKYLIFSFPCQFFWSVNMFRFSKVIVKSWLGASHVRSFDAVWNVWRLDACPLSELSPAQAQSGIRGPGDGSKLAIFEIHISFSPNNTVWWFIYSELFWENGSPLIIFCRLFQMSDVPKTELL